MIEILFARFRMFIRNPWTFVIMTVMSIGFAFILGENNRKSPFSTPFMQKMTPFMDHAGEVIEESEIFVFNG